ncbi:fibronectin type III domain-containing protein [Paenibacillus flagellatus]|uniref:Serine protease n=1 Tax=Paenibacillus flagellatus TaxID=2211139 RepID=A0A2V5K5C6_9BACL|nr:fibronectin type III domain-containing protein [Paenibacillus flagellatus]PYI52873.1 hypothetical protein DLM86_17845 [Paenibacillus flagellatus]
MNKRKRRWGSALLAATMLSGTLVPAIQAAAAPPDWRDVLAFPAEGDIQATPNTLTTDGQHHEVQLALLDDRGTGMAYIPDPRRNGQWALDVLDAESAWRTVSEATYGDGSGPQQQQRQPVVIAVIDTGVDAAHPDLAGRLLPGHNAIAGADPNDASDDSPSGHGTHVASVLAAVYGNGVGIAGAVGPAPVRLLPIKALGPDTKGKASDIAAAIRYAAGWIGPQGERVKAIHLSLGERLDLSGSEAAAELKAAVTDAQAQGVLLVAAAGNDGLPVAGDAASALPPYYPAAFEEVVSVGALDLTGERLGLSNSGADIEAPGEQIDGAMPGGDYGSRSGTSSAAPFVTAAAALMWAAKPDAKAEQVRAALYEQPGERWTIDRALQRFMTGRTAAPKPGKAVRLLAATGFEKISNAIGGLANTGDSGTPSVSEDGRYVAFDSNSRRLVSGDYNGFRDIFLFDRVEGSATRLSLTPFKGEADGDSFAPTIAPDGERVLFASKAANLTETGEWGTNLYIYDRSSDSIRKVADGGFAEGATENGPTYAMSANGQIVAFSSEQPNGVEEDANGYPDVFVKDLRTGLATRLTNHDYLSPDFSAVAITPDGRYVAFDSKAKLTADDRDAESDVYVYDRLLGTTELVSKTASPSFGPSISADGRTLAFVTRGPAFGDESLQVGHVELYDRTTGRTERIGPVTETGDTGEKSRPVISADGQIVVYEWRQWDRGELYEYDRSVSVPQNRLLTVSPDGEAADGASRSPVLSRNGSFLAFATTARNLAETPENGNDNAADIFFTDRGRALPEAPAWPVGAAAQAVQTGATYAALSWTPATAAGEGVPLYAIYEGERLYAIVRGTSYVVDGLTPNTAYTFRIVPGNDSYRFGEESVAVEVHTRIERDDTPPAAAQGNVVPQAGSLSVTWTDPSDADLDGIVVQWRKTGTASFRELPIVPAGRQNARIDGIVNGTFYDVRLISVDKDGNATEGAVQTVSGVPGRQIGRFPFSPAGRQPNNYSETSDVSDDGNTYVFSTWATNVVADDSNGYTDVFLYDRGADRIVLISRSTEGGVANGMSEAPVVSGSGRYVAFRSNAGNLVDNPPFREQWAVYLFDRDADGDGVMDEADPGATSLKRISPDDDYRDFDNVSVSRDGSTVAFTGNYSEATDPLYVYDTAAGTAKVVIEEEEGYEPELVDMSANGRYLSFVTDKAYDPDDTNDRSDLYLYDTDQNTFEWVSRFDSEEGMPRASYSSVSDEGDVAYLFNPDEQTKRFGLYVYDRSEKRTIPVSETPLGDVGAPAISADGKRIVYQEYVDRGPEGNQDIYKDIVLYHVGSGLKESVLVTHDGQPGNGGGDAPALNGDGTWISFRSDSTNLVTGDTNGQDDLFYVHVPGTEDREPPQWPTGSELKADAVGANAVTLRWTAATDNTAVQSYRISYDGGGELTVPGTVTQATVEGLRPSTSYTFRVRASDAAGNTSEGPTVTVTTDAGSELVPLQAEALDNGDVRLTWPAADPAISLKGFRLYRTQVQTGEPFEIRIDNPAAVSYVDTGLQKRTAYTYTVKAVYPDDTVRDYTTQAQVTTRGGSSIEFASVQVPLHYRKYVSVGREATINVRAAAGAEGKAIVSYAAAAESGTATIEVPLTEDAAAPGRYAGKFIIAEGMTEIASVQVRLNAGGETSEAEALKGPLTVAGSIRIPLANVPEGGHDLLDQAQLAVVSKSAKVSTGVRLSAAGTSYTIDGLPPADDYEISLFSRNGQSLLRLPPEPFSVASGRIGDAAPIDLWLPSSLRVRVLKPNGEPFAGAEVMAKDTDGSIRALSRTNADGYTGELLAHGSLGETYQLKVDVGVPEYVEAATSIVLSKVGLNEETLTVPVRERVSLRGRILDSKGNVLKDARVIGSQRLSGRSYSFNGIVDGSGGYVLDLYEGAARIAVSAPDWGLETIDLDLQPGAHERDLVVNTPAEWPVTVNLYTINEDGTRSGPMDLDWRVISMFQIRSSFAVSTASKNPFIVKARPGDTVSFCANGSQVRMTAACGTTVISPTAPNAVDIELKHYGLIGTKIKGTLEYYTLVKLFYEEEDGRRELVEQKYVSYGNVELNVPKPGNYVVQWRPNGSTELYAEHILTIAEGQSIDLGTIRFEPAGTHYGGKEGNGIRVTPSELTVGGTIDVRAEYRNSGASATAPTVLKLAIPAGTDLLERSVVLNGEPLAAESGRWRTAGGFLLIDVGTVAPGTTGAASYKLQADPDKTSGMLGVSAFVQVGAAKPEPIGTAVVSVNPLRFDIPSRTGRAEMTVLGSAPAGSEVQLYDGDLPLGTTTASPNGTWRMKIKLNAGEGESEHRIRAEAERAGTRWSTQEKRVRFDSAYPEVAEFTMRQPDGRTVTIDTADGVATFPYVVATGAPFYMTAKFINASRVDQVRFVMAGQGHPAVRNADGSFSATLFNPKPGPISLQYTTTDRTVTPDRVPDEDEIRDRLPPAMKDVTITPPVIEGEPAGTVRTAAFQSSLGYQGGTVGTDFKVKMEKVTNYSPSSADVSRANQYGVPVYGFSFSHSMSNGTFSFKMTGYFPEERFSSQAGIAEALRALGGTDPFAPAAAEEEPVLEGANVGTFIKLSFQGAMKWSGAGKMWTGIDSVYSFADGLGVNESLKDLGDLIDAATDCSPSRFNYYRDWAEDLKNQAMAHEIAKAVLMIAGVALGPETFGLGTVAMFMLTNAAGKVMDGLIGASIDKMKAMIANDSECKKDDDENDPPEDPPETDPGPVRKDTPLADPKWIYDPSGYVYEVDPSERVEGVKATVLQWDEAESVWKPWDAEWYLQQNPLWTDRQGKYGWDVPEGKWKVMFEKEGFRTAYSDELIVLPPHLDVNVPLVSTLPPQVTAVEAAPGGTAIDLYFSRYVTLDSANANTITVTDNVYGTDIAGTVSAVGEKPYEGRAAARHLRFEPAAPIAVGSSVRVAVDGWVQSYAGVPLGDDYFADVTVTAKDTKGPGKVTDIVSSATQTNISVMWKDPSDPDFSKVKLSWKVKGSKQACSTITVDKGKQWATIPNLCPGTEYEIGIAAYDAQGNASETQTIFQSTLKNAAVADTSGPRQVGSLTAVPGTNEIRLTWKDPDDADLNGIRISWRKQGDTEESPPATVAKGTQAYTIAGVLPSTEYEISAVALDKTGNESMAVAVVAATKSAGGNGNGNGNGGGGGSGTGGNGGAPSPGPITAPTPPKPAGKDVETFKVEREGGEFRAFDGAVRLQVAADAFDRTAELALAKEGRPAVPQDGTWKPVSIAYSLTEKETLAIRKPVALELAYEKNELGSADPRKLGIYRQDDGKPSGWTYVGGIVDAASGRISVNTDVPGVYAVLLNDVSFADLDAHWSRSDVEVLASRQAVDGIGGGLFDPDRAITRAEFAKLLVGSLEGRGGPSSAPSAPEFADVRPGDWFYEAVGAAAALGLVEGADGRFRPNDPVTREEAAVMLMRALAVRGGAAEGEAPAAGEPLAAYRDGTDVSEWAREAVAWSVSQALLQGMDGDRLEPQGRTTRAQAAVLLLRALQLTGAIENR